MFARRILAVLVLFLSVRLGEFQIACPADIVQGVTVTGGACIAPCGGVDQLVQCLCDDLGNGFVVNCLCSSEFILSAAGTCLAPTTCAAKAPNSCVGDDLNAVCTDIAGGFTCSCNTGFIVVATSQTTQTCKAAATVTQCNAFPTATTTICQAGGDAAAACTNTNGQPVCTCSSGYQATPDGKNCLDLDECANSTLTQQCAAFGDTAAGCANTAGSYACTCSTGYVSVGISGVATCYLESQLTTTTTAAPNIIQQKFTFIGNLIVGTLGLVALIILSPLLLIGGILILPCYLIYTKLTQLNGNGGTIVIGRSKYGEKSKYEVMFKNVLDALNSFRQEKYE